MPPEAPLTKIAQRTWDSFLEPGAWVVDATAGNGHDTQYLAQAVGSKGRVFAFDIQEVALRATANRLEQAGLSSRATLIRADHAKMSAHLPCASQGRMNLVCFNLGYLPNGDHSLTTNAISTGSALKDALDLLKPSGALSIIAYRGHRGAMEETDTVRGFVNSLPSPWSCLEQLETGGTKSLGPVWWLIAQK